MFRYIALNYPNEMGRFHISLPSIRSAYVTLKDFTPDLQRFYTDISAISVTFCNSAIHEPPNYALNARNFTCPEQA